MKIAITGGTGFVGRNLARTLVHQGHEVVLLARGHDQTDPSICTHASVQFQPVGLDDMAKLAAAFAGCAAVVHCAGINRETGAHTFQRVHVEGTRNVVAAEEIVRHSGLDYTIFKCGVIYGPGDHMLDHLSHAFYTFPLFAFVGFTDKAIRPNAVDDVAGLVAVAVTTNALSRQTVAVLGPEALTLRQAVRRVAGVVGKKPLMFPLPLWFHYLLAWFVEKIMTTPLISIAQVRILSEGLAEPWPPCDPLPAELAPEIKFSEAQIRRGLPPRGPFGLRDLHCCRHNVRPLSRRVFLELP